MRRVWGPPDPLLFVLAAAATLIGAVMIFDAGYARSLQTGAGAIPREFRSQIIFSFAALFFGWMAANLSIERWRRLSVPLFFASLLSLLAVELIGKEMNGAKRWIEFGPISIQPAEFVKVTVILYLAAVFVGRKPWKARAQTKNWGEWLDFVFIPRMKRAMPALFVLVAVALVNKEPDLGTAAVIAATLFAMMILGGVSKKSLIAFALLGCVGIAVMTIQEPYRMDRILNHSQRWDPEHRDDVGFQTTTSETAMAAGGLAGVGIGSGRAKHLMPAATTDFILATVAEEFGLIGVYAVLGVLGGIVFRLLALARGAQSFYGQLVLCGTAAWIGLQTCVNVMMANGTLPAIGIPLPFVSSGGSSLVALWVAIGICQAAVAQRVPKEAEVEARSDGRWDRRPRFSRA